MRDSYNTITITASATGAGFFARSYGRTPLREALSSFGNSCERMIREQEGPDGTFFRYHPDAVWSIESISLR